MGDDIRQKLPIESIDYDILTEEWKEITIQISKENNLFRTCYSKCMLFTYTINQIKTYNIHISNNY